MTIKKMNNNNKEDHTDSAAAATVEEKDKEENHMEEDWIIWLETRNAVLEMEELIQEQLQKQAVNCHTNVLLKNCRKAKPILDEQNIIPYYY